MSRDVVVPVLEKAIEKLRSGNNDLTETSRLHGEYAADLAEEMLEVANDLALLHAHLTLIPIAGRRARLRVIHSEEIAAEVQRGEHRDDDWSAD